MIREIKAPQPWVVHLRVFQPAEIPRSVCTSPTNPAGPPLKADRLRDRPTPAPMRPSRSSSRGPDAGQYSFTNCNRARWISTAFVGRPGLPAAIPLPTRIARDRLQRLQRVRNLRHSFQRRPVQQRLQHKARGSQSSVRRVERKVRVPDNDVEASVKLVVRVRFVARVHQRPALHRVHALQLRKKSLRCEIWNPALMNVSSSSHPNFPAPA